MSSPKDLTGQKFGRLTVLDYAYSKRKSQKYKRKGYWHFWHCQCECGNLCTVNGNYLKNRGTKSCGCLWLEKVGPKGKHNMSSSRLYSVWEGMRSRCNNPNTKYYKYYGGRGIRVSIEWDDFTNFYDWAMQNGYHQNAKHGECTLDRIDNDGDYRPDNCRWVTMKVQVNNRRPRRKKGEI